MATKSTLAGVAIRLALLGGALVSGASQAEPGYGGEVEWPHYAADQASSKYLPVDLINPGNVRRVVQKWVWESPDNAIVAQANAGGMKLWPNANEATPLMAGGRLYVITSLSQIAAIDAATGKTLWVFNPKSYLAADGATFAYPPNIGFVQRGVSYWKQGDVERIFFATGSALLIALDARTGKPDSTFGSGGVVDLKQDLRRSVSQTLYGMSSPPIVCGGAVIVGSNILDFPLAQPMAPGDVRGFDPRTGQLLWTFHTVPENGETGASTWVANDNVNTGGANVWAPMSCDGESGIVYLPVSTPSNDYYGGKRAGDGWFGDSLLALRGRTGKLVWNYQLIHHGLWDYDPPAAPTLFDVRHDGRLVKAVAQVSKQGFVYVFDRTSGKPIWPIVERPAPPSTLPTEAVSPTQPTPTRPLPFDRQGVTDDDLIDFTPALRAEARATVAKYVHGPLYTPPSVDQTSSGGTQGTLMMPGNVGGSSWAGAAYSPETGYLYVPSVTKPSVIGLFPFSTETYAGVPKMLKMPDGLPISKPPYGRLTAIDMRTGDHAWMRPVGRGPVDHPALAGLRLGPLGWDRRSFFIATSGLLFGTQEGIVTANPTQLSRTTTLNLIKNDDAYLWALDPRTGRTLLELPMRYGNASGSPMTYVTHNRQYIVVPVGGGGNPARLVAYGLP
ncbi:pyrroloquinoline quinone-dependent dehydrogenase [Burkholderia ubonensis]|uniref:pyrroloquinoline quinone-dependent dehydrogenase n=1 Tax=Burkholderia ubonensis TaxID=101571 RepID=UPI00075A43E6|nr:pyrroloquinoline quinone-dependent dehydrogenase [Burkholderia ubonensis]KWN72162.1 quinate dehydrogenase [Burkholderia ubonensis]